jgi:hypothetical protein
MPGTGHELVASDADQACHVLLDCPLARPHGARDLLALGALGVQRHHPPLALAQPPRHRPVQLRDLLAVLAPRQHAQRLAARIGLLDEHRVAAVDDQLTPLAPALVDELPLHHPPKPAVDLVLAPPAAVRQPAGVRLAEGLVDLLARAPRKPPAELAEDLPAQRPARDPVEHRTRRNVVLL